MIYISLEQGNGVFSLTRMKTFARRQRGLIGLVAALTLLFQGVPYPVGCGQSFHAVAQ